MLDFYVLNKDCYQRDDGKFFKLTTDGERTDLLVTNTTVIWKSDCNYFSSEKVETKYYIDKDGNIIMKLSHNITENDYQIMSFIDNKMVSKVEMDKDFLLIVDEY